MNLCTVSNYLSTLQNLQEVLQLSKCFLEYNNIEFFIYNADESLYFFMNQISAFNVIIITYFKFMSCLWVEIP